MAQMESEQGSLLRVCQASVDRLVAARDWQLLQRDEWARQAFELLLAGQVRDAQRATVYVYSQALHAACSGAEGPQRQNLGYGELFRYLYDGARHKHPATAEDVTQRAVERVLMLFDRCRTPGAFLAFAFQQLLDAARTIRRREELDARSRLTKTTNGGFDLTRLPDQRQADLSAGVIADELQAGFERLSIEFLRKHPRAKQQFTALRLKYIDGLDEATISRRLGKPIRSVYTLRARAIEKLRAEPAWRALAVEFGILPEESNPEEAPE